MLIEHKKEVYPKLGAQASTAPPVLPNFNAAIENTMEFVDSVFLGNNLRDVTELKIAFD